MSRAAQYWDERLREHGGLRGVGVVAYSEAWNRWVYRVRRRVFARALRRLRADWSEAVVLDAGAGTGFFLDRWSEAGARELWGLDCSGETIHRLLTSHPQVRLMQADLGEPSPGIADAAFDAVGCIDTLVHIVDESACRMALANFARWQRPGRLLLLSGHFLRRGERRHAHYCCRRSLTFYQRQQFFHAAIIGLPAVYDWAVLHTKKGLRGSNRRQAHQRGHSTGLSIR